MYDGFLGGLVRRYGWRKFQIACWTITVSGVLFWTLLFVLHSFASTVVGVAIGFLGAGSLCIGIPLVITIPNRRRRYTVFETALARPSELDPFIEDQPTPDIAALELPISIDLETRKPIARFGAITAWLLFAGMFVTTRNAFVLLPLALITMGIIVSIVRDHDVALGADGQQVRVDEDEMIVSSDRTKRDAMMWDDGRVFALIWGGNGIYATKVYMLSSGDHEVRWKHRLRTHWYSLAAPTTSDEIYNQQMNALLSYAVARTGLPLIDLR